MWRKLRLLILLLILATVAQQAWLKDGAPDWHKTLYVSLYPINADGSPAANEAVLAFQQRPLEQIEDYFNDTAAVYRLGVKPFALRASSSMTSRPPIPPSQSLLGTIAWSLQFRWWAWRYTPASNIKPDIRLYLLFYDPSTRPVLSHSTALSKGRIGLVNLFASRRQVSQNDIIIAHELLHTVGASDKYDLATTLPIYPTGYAEPQREPLYPQPYAELMGGRRPLSETSAEIPESLQQVVIGETTAREIGWRRTS